MGYPLHYPRYKPAERLAYLLLLMIVFILGVGAMAKGWYEHLAFNTRGVVIEGVVTNYALVGKGYRQLAYQYEVPGSQGLTQTFESTKFITRNLSGSPGDVIWVVYLPDRTQLSDIKGNRFLLIGDIAWATVIFAIVESFVGVLLFLHIKDWRQK